MDLRGHTAFALLLLQEEGMRSPEEWLQFGTLVLTRIVEGIGALVIAAGVIRAVIAWVAQHLPGGGGRVATESIRIGLGRSLSLALEFLLAADILSTAVAPSWEAIGKLAAIAAIRTALNYFLERELAREERRRQDEVEPAAAGEKGPAEERVTVRRTAT